MLKACIDKHGLSQADLEYIEKMKKMVDTILIPKFLKECSERDGDLWVISEKIKYLDDDNIDKMLEISLNNMLKDSYPNVSITIDRKYCSEREGEIWFAYTFITELDYKGSKIKFKS